MELSKSLVCPCNGKLYKSSATMRAHKVSNAHMLWELPQQVKDLEVRATRFENENDHLKRLNSLLIDKLKQYDKKIL